MCLITLKRVFKTKFEFLGPDYVMEKMEAFVEKFLPILQYVPEDMSGVDVAEYQLLKAGGLSEQWFSLWQVIQHLVSSAYKTSKLGLGCQRMLFGTVSLMKNKKIFSLYAGMLKPMQRDWVFWFTGPSYLVFTLTYCMYNCLLE